MKTTVVLLGTLLAAAGAAQVAFAQIATHAVISEVYINAATGTEIDEFVELYNPTGSTITFTTSDTLVTHNASNPPSNRKAILLNGHSIPSHKFFLIGRADVSPTPDTIFATMSLTNSGGSAILKSNSTIIDAVGWGATLVFEGTALPGSPTELSSYERKAQSSSTASSMQSGGSDEFNGNGWDFGDNSSDFITRTSAQPQNLSSSAETPPATGNSPPIISSVARSKFVADVSGVDTVTANISDVDGVVVTARLHIKVNGGADDSSVTMSVVSAPQYRGVIPAGKHASAGNLVEYFISAVDDSSKYSTTSATTHGYFVGDAPISSIKSRALSGVAGYAARVNGVINVKTNTFSNGQGFIQDATGGLQLFQTGGLPNLDAGRNAKIEGTLTNFQHAYELGAPGLTFVDTTGTSSLTATTITLPIAEDSTYANEGKLVKIVGLSTAASGTFADATSYSFHEADTDTITVRSESNGGANTLIGSTIPAGSVDAIGILSYSNSYHRLKPRKAEDMGSTPPLTFEAAQTGNWSDTSTWSGHVVPGAADNVTMTSVTGIVVTIDITNAQCNNLTMTGSGSASTSGAVLQFGASPGRQLTVNGDLTISGGSGPGGGDRGGRPQLTSAGNSSAILILKGNIAPSSSNSVANGEAGLNMNEGTVKVQGSGTSTLNNGAGFRMADLIIGDGVATKTLNWAPTSLATMSLSSLTVKNHATFNIGSATNLLANDIGNYSASGVPTLDGGITVEGGGAIINQDFGSGQNIASINLDGGGITNNGTLDLNVGALAAKGATPSSPLTGCIYNVRIGGFPAAAASSSQSIGGTNAGQYGNMTIASGHTLTLNQDVTLPLFDKVTLGGTLIETPGNTVVGVVEATRAMSQSVAESFGGIGLTLNAAGGSPDTTVVTRVTGVAQTGGSHTSILRYFDITPQNNSGLNATLDCFYDDSELDGQTASTLTLWKSGDGGGTWSAQGGTVSVPERKISLTGVNSFSRWTAADAAHSLGSSSAEYDVTRGWNMVSVALTVPDYHTDTLYPSATTAAFLYSNGYVSQDILQNGPGYWLKFGANETVSITGSQRTLDSIDVGPGWNLVGSISDPVPSASVGQSPASNVQTPYYRYSNGYQQTDTLFPGQATWVKVNSAGTLILASGALAKASAQPDPFAGSDRLTISDDEGRSQTLFLVDAGAAVQSGVFDMPPAPPAECFDARFASGRIAEAYPGGASSRECPIRVSTQAYPLRISWNVGAEASRSAVLSGSGGKTLAVLQGRGSIVVADAREGGLRLTLADRSLPSEFSLGRSYPNPFNPSTTFTLAVPEAAPMSVAVYDVTGRRIAVLHRGELAAGVHSFTWNGAADGGAQAGSGVYFLRVSGGGFNAVQKLMLLK